MHREIHAVLFACMFAEFDWESSATVDDTAKPTARAHPWQQQLAQDVAEMSVLDPASYLVSQLQGRVLLLLTDFRDDFMRVDLAEFRSRFLGHEIPPPGWVERPDDASEIFVPR